MIRVIGFILIVSGSSCCGILQAAAVRRTARCFVELRKAILLMKSEISCSLATIEQLSLTASQLLSEPLSGLFRSIAGGIANDPSCSTAWLLREYYSREPAVPSVMRDILLDLFRLLGRQDTAAQLRALDLADARAQAVLQQLEKEKAERCRSYRILGICTGLALAIVLL